ncbi:hypothetical protein [Polaribacter sp. Asnod6-C07]|uniref:hypothetical protein n=1 Tax=Polaribacter sp. Asnod6-C07 TaxID=3160582 RepID=UPI00386E7890
MIGKFIKYGNKYTAVEHAENNSFSILQLVQKKKELQIFQRKIVHKQEDVINVLKDQKHIFLILNDEQVLAKRVEFTDVDKKKIVKTAFPNIILNDFYFELYTDDIYSFVAIARKETIDVILNLYLKAGIFVIDFSIGNLAIQHLLRFQKNKILTTSNANIYLENNKIVIIEKQEVATIDYNINDIEVSNIELLSLAGIIAYYTENTTSSIQGILAESYKQKRFFDIGLKAGLGFLLLILLVNFFAFTNYRDQVGNLSAELQISQTYKSQLNTLQKKVTQKKQLIQGIQSGANISISKYFDELGISLPESSMLTQIYFQPKEGIQKDDKPYNFKKNIIIVKGESKNDEAFSNWISFLEQKSWIKEVLIMEYGRGKNKNMTSSFEFIIKTND